ncbi:HEAT repeat domain-containing protein [Cellulophaga sp. L1A9]|uniref:HEAT repeat domain-containing protein n=1 Tax=Cellulophaga sp. L1A9 TaxID=2686362 RepID=UPI00131B53A5|nr:HEAT repeat domain-containing protein [Cellulophaga sp. L1A9]
MISAPKIHTDILWDLSVLFVILSAVYFVAIFFYRNKFLKKSADTSRRKNTLAPLVSEFLFYQEQEGSKDEKKSYIQKKIEIRELIKDVENEKVLTEILLDLKKDVSGDTRKQLFKLYKDLNLEIRAFEKLKSWKWQKISQAMFELTQMQVAESYDFISGFINDKRSVIRKQAEISSVTLDHNGISYFLDTTVYQISEWQQLKILEVLSNHEDFDPPRFYKWLTSKNKHVILFALRLIKHYDQDDSRASIIALMRHKNSSIKLEAINCIKQFYFVEAKPALKTVFWKNRTNVKLAILDTLAEIGDKAELSFLLDVAHKERNFTVKSKALSAMNSIQPEYIIPTEDIELFDEEEEEPPLKINTPTVAAEEDTVPDENIALSVDSHEEVLSEVLPQTDIIDTMYAAMVEFIPKDVKVNQLLVDQDFSTEEAKQFLKHETVSISGEEIPFEAEIDADKEEVDYESIEIQTESKVLIKQEDSFDNVAEDLAPTYESIFKSLFEKSDDACKLILLEEMVSLADDKDLAFLNSLENYPNPKIKSKASFVIHVLKERIKIETPEKGVVDSMISMLNEISKDTTVAIHPEVNQEIPINLEEEVPLSMSPIIEKLKSLEYCFLEEEKEHQESEYLDLFDINFQIDLAPEKRLADMANDNVVRPIKHEHALTQEEHGFFQQFLDFPVTVIDKLHG